MNRRHSVIKLFIVENLKVDMKLILHQVPIRVVKIFSLQGKN
jgi:hypothetical protein